MEPNKTTSSKCGDVLHKGSSFLSFISLLLIVALFLRMESINRKSEMNEMRISKVESRVQTELLETTDHRNDMETLERYRQRKQRNAPQTQDSPAISLQQIRQEIKEKLSQACTSKHKICQEGLPGPKGDVGPPGYKGERGAPGVTGPQGPLGPIGAPGPSGKQGRKGQEGIKGDLGAGGPRGIPGEKGDVGPIGRPGEKGSIGLEGNKGNRGYTGLQGPKGECIVNPKVSIYPVSQEVLINARAIFYCWVESRTSKQITWSKLGGALLKDTTVKDGALVIKNVQKSHVGSYICTVHTGYGILKAISNLHLKEPPIFTKKPPSHVVLERGSTVSLCCEATGSPRPRIEWSRAKQSQSYLPPAFQENGCLEINTAEKYSEGDYICRSTNRFGLAETLTTVIVPLIGASCDQIHKERPGWKKDGIYNLYPTRNAPLAVYCEMYWDGKGWSLIARFSNNDNKNWMRDDGSWWYDRQVAMGTTTNPFINKDMISPAFWLISGREFKITRSDDPSHTALLQTTDNCLAGQTFRSKITSYGDFRNGKVWASNQCLGSCTVEYDRLYKSTDGFQQAECSGDIQSANKIGFWCDRGNGDGSMMMIGGGGGSCSGADHGIGITEADAASFVEAGAGETEYDFGYDAKTGGIPSQSYSLNLWIR